MYQALPQEQRFGMFFEKVKGSSIPIVTAAMGASTAAYAATLDVEPGEINAAWVRACRNPVDRESWRKRRARRWSSPAMR